MANPPNKGNEMKPMSYPERPASYPSPITPRKAKKLDLWLRVRCRGCRVLAGQKCRVYNALDSHGPVGSEREPHASRIDDGRYLADTEALAEWEKTPDGVRYEQACKDVIAHNSEMQRRKQERREACAVAREARQKLQIEEDLKLADALKETLGGTLVDRVLWALRQTDEEDKRASAYQVARTLHLHRIPSRLSAVHAALATACERGLVTREIVDSWGGASKWHDGKSSIYKVVVGDPRPPAAKESPRYTGDDLG